MPTSLRSSWASLSACHAYCTYCFRWPQFVGESELRIATDDIATTSACLRAHPEVTSALITGGDTPW
jgi:L-lysine 2,3-aminomutase